MAEITIQEYIFENWQFDSATVELRIFANQYFVSPSGVVFQPPAVDQSNGIWYQAITCVPDLTARTLTIPEFTLESTTDGQPNNATYQFVFYSGPQPSGIPIVSFFGLSNAVVGTSPLVTNLPALININGQPAQSNLFSYYAVFWQIAAAFWAAVPIEENATSFSVLNHQSFFTQNTEATDITEITDGYQGDVIYIFVRDDHTSIFGNLRGNGSFLTFGFNGTDWISQSAASGVDSFNGRIGVVVPEAGDYTAAQVTNAASVIASNAFLEPQNITVDSGADSAALLVRSDNASASYIQNYVTNGNASAQIWVGNLASGGKTAILGIYGPNVNGAIYTGGPIFKNTAFLFTGQQDFLFQNSNAAGVFWWAINDTTIAKLSTTALELKKPLQLDGSTSGSTQLTVPAVAGDFKVVLPSNIPDIGDTLTVLTVTLGTPNIIVLDYEAGGGGGSPAVYDLAGQAFGLLAPNQVVYSFVACRAFTLGITGSTGYCGTVPTADTDFIVQYSTDNGATWTTKATLRFAAASHVSTIVSSVSTSVASGDLVQVLAPASPDLTLADVTLTIKSKATDATSYDLSGQVNGGLANSQVVFTFVADRSFTLSLTGSTGSSGTAANAQTDFLIRYSSDNGSTWTTKGTLRFAAAAKVTTLVGEVSTSVVSGNLVQLIGPATADTTLSDVTFSLVGSV